MQMRVYAYRAAQKGPRPLGEIFDRILQMPLSARSFLGENSIRLETAEQTNGIWFVDFAKPRNSHGPGKMSREKPISEIEMVAGDSFAEDTGLAFNQDTGYLAIQYNHFGPRSSAIEQYISAADLSFGGLTRPDKSGDGGYQYGFNLGSVLKPNAYARLRSWGIYKSFDMKVSVPGAVGADLNEGRSLLSVLNGPLPEGVASIRIGIDASPKRDGKLGEDGAMGLLNDLRKLGPAVKNAVVRGKPTETDPIDEVNLIRDRLSTTVNLTLGKGLRFVRSDRWDALGKAIREWQEDGSLPVAQ